jgi:hypothetical protein
MRGRGDNSGKRKVDRGCTFVIYSFESRKHTPVQDSPNVLRRDTTARDNLPAVIQSTYAQQSAI